MKTKEYLWGLICRLVHTVREEWSQEGEFIVPVEDDLTVNEGYRLLEMVDDAIGVTNAIDLYMESSLDGVEYVCYNKKRRVYIPPFCIL